MSVSGATGGRDGPGYPVVAITDVHGQRAFLDRLLDRLAGLPGWPRCAVVFIGDYVDRGPDVRGTLDRVVDLTRRHPGGVWCVAGNHDLALTRAARLDGGPRSDYWEESYRARYDHGPTFRAYLGRSPAGAAWEADLAALRDAMPEAHRDFLAGLPWLAESPGHLFLHCGLSPELGASAEAQVDALRGRRWDRVAMAPRPGTATDARWEDAYPVWLGADKRLSESPLPCPGRVQVSGHKPVPLPDVDDVRIRLDTSGGLHEPLTACLLTSADAPPVFLRSDGGTDTVARG